MGPPPPVPYTALCFGALANQAELLRLFDEGKIPLRVLEQSMSVIHASLSKER
jgi:hypothetical protein